MQTYPLIFEAMLKEKVWGGRRLESLGGELPDGAMVGESWEVADLDETSVEGGGGGSASSVIANGEMRGMTLRDAVRAMGTNLMGTASLSGEGGFPLLVKYLDARENLSVQVHPSAAYAAAHPGAHLKTESWYVVEAEAGSKIYTGMREGVTARDFEARARSGGSVEADLVAVEVRAGDFVHLESGTCHALGAGVMVAEVQTASDTTFRVYDWGRKDRAIHIEEAMACIRFGESARVVRRDEPWQSRGVLESNEFYEVREVVRREGATFTLPASDGGASVWMCLSGDGVIESLDDGFERVAFTKGSTILLPAALGAARAVFEHDSVVLETEVRGRG